jgi:hypothetical protein
VFCRRCEDVKKTVKASGHTLSEFRKGLASGHVSLDGPLDHEAIDHGLQAMLLGRPAAPRQAGSTRAERALFRDIP